MLISLVPGFLLEQSFTSNTYSVRESYSRAIPTLQGSTIRLAHPDGPCITQICGNLGGCRFHDLEDESRMRLIQPHSHKPKR